MLFRSVILLCYCFFLVVASIKTIHIAFGTGSFCNTIGVGYLTDNVKRRFGRLDVLRGKMFHRQFISLQSLFIILTWINCFYYICLLLIFGAHLE